MQQSTRQNKMRCFPLLIIASRALALRAPALRRRAPSAVRAAVDAPPELSELVSGPRAAPKSCLRDATACAARRAQRYATRATLRASCRRISATSGFRADRRRRRPQAVGDDRGARADPGDARGGRGGRVALRRRARLRASDGDPRGGRAPGPQSNRRVAFAFLVRIAERAWPCAPRRNVGGIRGRPFENVRETSGTAGRRRRPERRDTVHRRNGHARAPRGGGRGLGGPEERRVPRRRAELGATRRCGSANHHTGSSRRGWSVDGSRRRRGCRADIPRRRGD